MNRIVRLFFTLILTAPTFVAIPSGHAQEETPAAEDVEAGEASDGDMFGGFGEGFDFDKIQTSEMEGNMDTGVYILTGNVILESPELSLKCNKVRADGEKLVATGSPVYIEQGNVKAECRTFTHDLQTKRSVLEGEPVIYERGPENTKKMSGDVIHLYQTASGGTGFHAKSNPGSARPVTIESIPNNNGTSDKDSREPAKEVNETNTELIRMPEIDE